MRESREYLKRAVDRILSAGRSPAQVLPAGFVHLRDGAVRTDPAAGEAVEDWLRREAGRAGAIGVTYVVPGRIVLEFEGSPGEAHVASVVVTDHAGLPARIQEVQAVVGGRATGWFEVPASLLAAGIPLLFGS